MAKSPGISQELQSALQDAYGTARERRHEYVTIEHLLFTMLGQKSVEKAFVEFGVNPDKFRDKLETFVEAANPKVPPRIKTFEIMQTSALDRVLQRAAVHAISSEIQEIKPLHVIVNIFQEKDSQAAYMLGEANIKPLDIKRYLSADPLDQRGEGSEGRAFSPTEDDEENKTEDLLAKYTVDLNALAKSGQIDPLIGRDDELERINHVLLRRKKNNPLLVGDPGVGKTAIAEGLALNIVEGRVPEPMRSSRVFSIEMGSMLAGTKYRGQFEERLRGVLKALEEIPEVIVFIDEIHTLVGAGATSGGSMDASNLLKPSLAGGKIRVMGSTTFEEYKQFEKDRALSRRFGRIDIQEPSLEDCKRILFGLKDKYETHHQVHYSEAAVNACVDLSAKYINERKLPDKAIDVLDEAGASARLKHPVQTHIDVKDIEVVVSKIAQVPVQQAEGDERNKLLGLEAALKRHVFGQDEAVESLAAAIKMSRAGLRDPQKTVGNFLLSGPTGVGKTELARTLAKELGIELIRFDMSEYQEKHAVSRLIGAPPGYVGYEQGGLLTDAIRKKPHAVLLLDEIEKAHPDLFNILLQVMDHATLTDNNGRKSDFRNVVIILTTNAGARDIAQTSIGFGESKTADPKKSKEAIERTFSPEFRNRLDATVMFQPLNRDVILKIVDKEVDLLRGRLKQKQIDIHVTESARQWLAQHGYEPAMGARPMARLVEKSISRVISEAILAGKLAAGKIATVDLAKNGTGGPQDSLVVNLDAQS